MRQHRHRLAGLTALAAPVLLLLASSALIQQVDSQQQQQQHQHQQQQQQVQQSCHLRELDLCAASLLVFAQSPNGLATSEHELNAQCKHISEADSCFKNYTRRCMTNMQRQLINFAANATFQLGQEYCTKGSQLRLNYLKHAQCLNQVQKISQKTCIRDLQVSLDMLASSQGGGGDPEGKRLQLACCTYHRFESCVGDRIDKRCGKEATAFIQQTIRRASSRLPEMLCLHYKPNGLECKQVLPKSGETPKGFKSNSIVSRLLSAYSGLR